MTTRMAKPALDVGLVSTDAAPLLRFYEALGGMTALEPLTFPGVGTVHKLAAGQSVLRILVPEKPPAPDDSESFSSRMGIRYLTLEVNDIDAAAAAVRAHGGQMVLEPFELRPGRRVAQVTDPDGNLIELGQGQG